MKYIKTFEDLQEIPQVGDYVLCKDYITRDIESRISSKIGVIINYDSEYIRYTIKYEPKKTPSEHRKKLGINTHYMRRGVDLYSIVMWSKNKDDIEAKITAKKYNI